MGRCASSSCSRASTNVPLSSALGHRRLVRLSILARINDLLDPAGPRFALVQPFDQTALVVAVTGAEHHLLETERGWRFADLIVPGR